MTSRLMYFSRMKKAILNSRKKGKMKYDFSFLPGKKISLICLLMLAAGMAGAQFSGGIKINIGMGGIRSSNLEKSLSYQDGQDPQVTEWSAKQSWGPGYGIGGYIAYSFSDQLSFIGEPTLSYLKCDIDIKRVENKVNGGDGDITTDATTSKIQVTYLNLPLLFQYKFGTAGFMMQAGLAIDFTGSPSISSTDNSIKESYKNGNLDKTTVDPSFTLDTKLDVFESPRFNFVIGAGKVFDVNGKDLSIALRYSLPLTQSEMYTTDGGYNDGRFSHNDLLGIDGKTDAEKNAPYLLDDFKMSTLTLSFGYQLFGK